jgi:hypothetical protein
LDIQKQLPLDMIFEVSSNRVLGRLHLAAASVFFAYYSLWVLATPFVDPAYSAAWARVFPPVSYALVPPAVASTTIFLALLARAYYLVRQSRKKK